jgi:hypothetical protein
MLQRKWDVRIGEGVWPRQSVAEDGGAAGDGATAREGVRHGGGRSAVGLTRGHSQDRIEVRDGLQLRVAGHGRWRGMDRGRPDTITGCGI